MTEGSGTKFGLRLGATPLLVILAFGLTAGAALAGRGAPPKEDPAARAKAELVAAGLQPVHDGDLAPVCEALERETHVAPLLAQQPFKLTLANGPLEGDPLPPERAKTALSVLRRELARYSPERLEAAGLQRVVLAADLRESGKLISSLPNVSGSLLLDGSVPESFLARLVHHEIFHFLDFADADRHHEDDAWSQENHLFAYGEGGRSVRSPRASELTDEMPGFLTRYAMSAVEEDKAEVFSLLMTRPADVRGRAHADEVVRAKVRRMNEKLARVAPELAPVAQL